MWNDLRPIRAVLLNGAGQVVRSVVLRSGRNAIDLDYLAKGLYLLQASSG